MARKKNKPTVDDILELYDDCKRRYSESGLWGQLQEDESFYELDFRERLLLPEEFQDEGIVLPTARDLVDSSVDNTDIFNVRVWANRKGTSPRSEDEQNLLRKFGLGVLYRNNVESNISPIRVAAKHYWMHGIGILKTVWDADRWFSAPEKKNNESEDAYAARLDEWRSSHHDSLPIVIKAVNPRQIMLDPYYDGGMFVFETREELCFNVKERYDWWSNPLGRKITDKVDHISFWTNEYRCELFDREPVLKQQGGVVQHKYGFIPYVPIDTGLGNLSSDNDLTKRYVGVLRYVKDLLISESRDYSIGDIILKRNAFPWGTITGPNAQSVTEIFQQFGQFNALPEGVELEEKQPKLPPDALLTWLGVAANYLGGHAAPPAVRGMGETGVRSGADRRLIIAQAATRYQYANEAFKHGVAKVLSNCARIMKNVVPGDIRVWARTPVDEFDMEIKKGSLKEPFNFYVEFAPISEEDEYRRHDDLERLVTSGIVVPRWARKQMSNVDPDQMEIDEQVELMMKSEAFQTILAQYAGGLLMQALQKRSRAESVDDPPPPINPVFGEGAPGQGGEAGRRVVAPIPNVPVPGSAQDIQNSLAAQRAPKPINQSGQSGGGNRR